MRGTSLISYLLCASVLLTGCASAPVADDVGQREANEIVAVLRERGIVGSVTKGKGYYSQLTRSGGLAFGSSVVGAD